MGIQEQLSQVTKDSKSVTDYMQTIKSLAGEIALIDAPLKSQDLTFHVPNGLGSDFEEVVAVVCARENPISFDELHDKLADHESFLKREAENFEKPTITANYANKLSQNGGK